MRDYASWDEGGECSSRQEKHTYLARSVRAMVFDGFTDASLGFTDISTAGLFGAAMVRIVILREALGEGAIRSCVRC